ncbi:MAG: DUF6472 family protein [Bacillota bacterium]|nr:DUF6472 family protein [Bacillota bacterium]
MQKRSGMCESCSNFCYDEDYDEYYCQVSLDQDEMGNFLQGGLRDCPYYMYNDEYSLARKQ